jgi:hypothetical protein
MFINQCCVSDDGVVTVSHDVDEAVIKIQSQLDPRIARNRSAAAP